MTIRSDERVGPDRSDTGAALCRALFSHETVVDCAVVCRSGNWIAYLVVDGAWRPEHLTAHLRSTARLAEPLLVPVAMVPRTERGDVDEPALLHVPVIEQDTVRQLEKAIATAAGVRDVAVAVESYRPAAPAIHVSELWPTWQRSASVSRRAEGDVLSEPAGNASIDESGRSAKASAGRRRSLSEGAALPAIPEMPRTLAEALRRAADASSSGITYVREDGSERHQTYADLLQEAGRMLRGLRASGRVAGEAILFQLGPAEDFLPMFWACVLGGYVAVPVAIAPSYTQPNATLSKLRHAWELLGQPLIVASSAVVEPVRSLGVDWGVGHWDVADADALRANGLDDHWHATRPDTVALMLLTSGSTGAPKAVQQSHRAMLARSLATCSYDGFTEADVSLNWFPLDHVGGLVMFHLRDVYAQCAQVQVPTQYILGAPLRWLDLVERHRATITWAPNFAFGLVNAQEDLIRSRRWDLSSLRFILNGGEAIVAKTARRFLELLAPHGLPPTAMRPAWGMSETCSGVTSSHAFTLATTHDDDQFVEVGPPLPGVVIRIVDENDCVVPEETVGRLQISGPPITSGYYGQPDVNREAFTPDGWFTTGDLGILRDGRLTITGRQKDVIIINGINYYCQEIEAHVEDVPGVEVSCTAACAVRFGGAQTDALAIVFHPTVDGDRALTGLLGEIRRKVVTEIGINPAYLVPVAKHDVPKTDIGKIQRAQLRRRIETGGFEDVLRRVDVLLESADTTVPDWFVRPVWRPQEAKPGGAMEGVSIVLGDEDGIGAAVARRLRSRGDSVVAVRRGLQFARLAADVYEIVPDAPDHYDRLLSSCAADGFAVASVIHTWTHGRHDDRLPTRFDLAEAGRVGTSSLIGLARALSTRHPNAGVAVRLLVVASHTQSVDAADPLACERVPVIGLLQALSAEQPSFRCTHVDVPGDDVEAAADSVAHELSSGAEPEVAYRRGRRYVRRLAPVDLRSVAPACLPFTNDGFYVVTGGLGGVGRTLAAHLLTEYRARLLLMGRSPLQDRAAAAAYAGLQRIAAAGGDLRYAAVDLSDADSFQAAIADAAGTWGCSLRGVLHLAGAYHDRAVHEETAATLAEVLAPKVEATCVIHEVLDHVAPDAWCVGFSSALGYFGGAMVGAYTAANRFLESAAAAGRRRGRRWISLGWSTWDQVGMSRGHSGIAALRARGFRDMPPLQAVRSLVAVLERASSDASSATGDLLVGLDRRHAFIRRHLAAGPLAVERLTAFAAAGTQAAVDAAIRAMTPTDRFGVPMACDVVPIRALPRDSSGHIDRARLVETSRGRERVAPRTERERQVVEVWQEVLGGAAPGIDDSFFELGGHSLLAMQVLARIKSRWHVELPLRALFEAPTVRSLATRIDAAFAEGLAAASNITRVSRESALPLSFAQQRLWFIDQLEPGSTAYNIPCVFRLRGNLDVAALERSLAAVVMRHEALRTRFFTALDGRPVQVIDPSTAMMLPCTDLSSLPRGEREAAARGAVELEAGQPFDLARGPLVRAALVRLDPRAHILIVTLHHIIGDGWSLGVLADEIGAHYASHVAGRPLLLPRLTVQYADYAVWQRQTLTGAHLDRLLAYWMRQLANLPATLSLPTDRPRPAVRSARGRKLEFVLAPQILADAARWIEGTDTTLFITLLAGFKAFLLALSGQTDLAVGSPIAGRPRPELEPLIGFFANTLLLRTRLGDERSFRSVVAAVRAVALEAYAHQDMPFEKLVEVLRPPRDRGRNPLFQVNFRVALAPAAPLALDGLDPAPLELVDTGTSKFDLALELSGVEGGTSYFEYSADLFDEPSIHRMRADFERLLAAMFDRPDEPLRGLEEFRSIADRVRPARAGKASRQRSAGVAG